MADKAPNIQKIEANVPAATIAATQDQTVGKAPFAGEVTAAYIVPEAALTASATDYRTWSLINKGQDGNGSTVIASFASDTVTTDDLADFDEKALTLSVVADATDVAAGDILAIAETVTGNGIAHSGYKVIVEVSRS